MKTRRLLLLAFCRGSASLFQEVSLRRVITDETVSSPWSRAAQQLLKPLSVLSLRRTSSSPPLPPISYLQPILDYQCEDEPNTDDVKTALAALLSFKTYEEQALKYISDGQGTQSGNKLVHASLAKGYLWSFGSIFTFLQRSLPGLIDDGVLPDLLNVPERVLRGFFIHWQTALRLTTDNGPEAVQAEATLEVIRLNLIGLGAQLDHGLDENEVTDAARAIIDACKITPLISTALAFTADQQHQVPRVIAPIPKTAQTATEVTTARRSQVNLGVLSSQHLYNLLHALRNALETVPCMYDARISEEVDDPVAVVEDLALVNERPLRLGLDLSLVKTDLALSVAVEQVRNAPIKAPSAGGKRGRGSLSSSRSRSMSRKAEALGSPEGNPEDYIPSDEAESPEDIEARDKRERHRAIIAQWEARAEESLISTMMLVRELLLRGKKSVMTRPGLLHHLVAEDVVAEPEVAIDILDVPQEGSSPLSEASSSSSEESQTSSVEPAYPCKPLESLIRLANRFFEWRIGRWESLGLKDTVRRDTYTRGNDGSLGDTWDLLGVSVMSHFEQSVHAFEHSH